MRVHKCNFCILLSKYNTLCKENIKLLKENIKLQEEILRLMDKSEVKVRNKCFQCEHYSLEDKKCKLFAEDCTETSDTCKMFKLWEVK